MHVSLIYGEVQSHPPLYVMDGRRWMVFFGMRMQSEY